VVSPETVRMSLAAALTLGLKRGLFYRGAKLGCINLLMEYEEGCLANCQYCGQGRGISETPDCRNLIRVEWPSYPLDQVVEATRAASEADHSVRRVCVGAISHRRAPEDMVTIVTRVIEGTGLDVSTLVTPTVFGRAELEAVRDAGAENITVAIDCCTEELFERMRGRGARGPHAWEGYLQGVRDAVEVMGGAGSNAVGVHLIIGLGETEQEAVEFIQRCYDMGARVHLFSFFPEPGSPLADRPQPPMGTYRRVQLARHLIDAGRSRADGMRFEGGRLVDTGVPAGELDGVIADGRAFMTSGCPGCNRPYANETPTQAMEGELRNYPFVPDADDIALIRAQL
jgi:biotin synthase-related radical SAM superfamily protein